MEAASRGLVENVMVLKKALSSVSLCALLGGFSCASCAELASDKKKNAVADSVSPKEGANFFEEGDPAQGSKRAQETAPQNAKPTKNAVSIGAPDFTRVVEKVINSVVSITADQEQPSRKDDLDQFGQQFKGTPFEDFFKNFMGRENAPRRVHVGGSGFFIQVDKECAYVVTNSHVVENAVRAKVVFDDKTEVPATLHGADPRTDLAVLRVEMKDIPADKRETLKPLTWGDSSKTAIGQWVLAFGNPFGLGNTVTAGIISAKGRNINTGGNTLTDDYIQHSAQINMGNSGGCLVDVNGRVIGINTVIITPSGGNVGIGLAITSANARKTITQLILHKEVQHGALGVSVQDFTKEAAEALDLAGYKSGAIVNQVTPDGPANKAGIKKGDIIVKFDDEIILDRIRLSRLVSEASVNTVHTVTVIRNGKALTIKVNLGDFDAINGTQKKRTKDGKVEAKKRIEIFGMTLMDPEEPRESAKNEDERLDEGAYVVKITPDSPADDVGLTQGDLIIAVNQKPIKTAQEFYDAALKAVKAGKRFLFLSVRNGGMDRFLSLRLEDNEELQRLAEGKAKKTEKSPKKGKKQEKTAQKEEKTEGAESVAESASSEEVLSGSVDESDVSDAPGVVADDESEAAERESAEAPEEDASASEDAPAAPKKGVLKSVGGWFSGLFK